MDNEETYKREILATLKRRLHERELQLAHLGINADPSIRTEIQDIKSEIHRIEQGIDDIKNHGFKYTGEPKNITTKWTFHIFSLPIFSLVMTKTIEMIFYFILTGTILAILGLTALTIRSPYNERNVRLALDPDDNIARADWPNGTIDELYYNLTLAKEIERRFIQDDCHVDILITRESSDQQLIPSKIRSNEIESFKPDVTVTLGFNSFIQRPWGLVSDGGVMGWARSDHPEDDKLVLEIFQNIEAYTSRPHTRPVQHPQIYPEFSSLTGEYAHIEVLFLDHNIDHVIIKDKFSLIVDAMYTSLRNRLENKNMVCR